MNLYGDTKEEKTRAITDLRDTLATLKWEIWESYGQYNRKDFDGTEGEKYAEDRFKEWPYFNKEYIKGLIYSPKGVISHDDAFEHVKKLVPNKNNAFLFDKNNKG